MPKKRDMEGGEGTEAPGSPMDVASECAEERGSAAPPVTVDMDEAAATVSFEEAEKVETDQPDFSDGQAQETPDAEQDKDEEAVEIVAENIVAESAGASAKKRKKNNLFPNIKTTHLESPSSLTNFSKSSHPEICFIQAYIAK